MDVNAALAEMLMEQRTKDALREVERERLGRAVEGPREERKWRLWLASVFRTPSAIFVNRRVDESRHPSASTASSPT